MNASLLSPCLLLLASAASAQIATLTLPAGTGDDPRSVVVINASNHLAISNQIDGWQHFVKVTNPLTPTLVSSYNPPFGDQWFEAEYTPQFGGRLFTAHRGGGINMIDVSNPLAPVSIAQVLTTYHFRGMRYRTLNPGGALFYNETNAGLGVFQVNATGTALNLVWNDYSANGDGNGMELVGDVLYQLGTPPSTPTDRLYRGFDIGNPFFPVMTMNNTFTGQAPTGAHNQLRKHPALPYMLVSRWNDGLELHNAAIPNSPVIYPIVPPNPAIRCWGAAFFGTNYAVAYGSVTIGTSTAYWWYLMQILPGPVIVPINVYQVPLDTHDVTYDPNTSRIYVVGRMNGNGQGVLWVF